MKHDIITAHDLSGKEEIYKVLAVIQKEDYYIIYTDINNQDIEKNLYLAKVHNLDNINNNLTITDEEWKMIENEYQYFLEMIRRM